ncbi:MAG: CBS domain-containing protein [Candidatus Thermoplasmatota archaeon]|nr:CBS domain-containing protein [Candidatus Thermoplasmatota archaeon]
MNKGDILVKEAMRSSPVTVTPTMTVKQAAEIMRKKKIGNCIVSDEKPIGILTESDILKKVVAEDLKASEVLVRDIMQTPLIVIDPYVEIEEAMKIMSKCNIRRLPVVEKGELIGIITQRDVLRLSPMLLEISREWSDIVGRDEAYLKKQVFSGKCEDCGTLSTNLRNVDGRLLCEDCIDALNYE